MNDYVAAMMRAAVAMQVAALEWENDEHPKQSEARQALVGMQEAMNAMHLQFAMMKRVTENRRAHAL